MMDYYEELGVDRAASPDEIRQAYKQLARLLHPDHCSDEAGRRLADLQMKRLHGILGVLTDPAERERYDRSLFGPPEQRLTLVLAPAANRLRWPRQWFWPVAAAATIAVLLAVLSFAPPADPNPAPPADPAPAVAAPANPARKVAPRRLQASNPPSHNVLAVDPGQKAPPAPEPAVPPPAAAASEGALDETPVLPANPVDLPRPEIANGIPPVPVPLPSRSPPASGFGGVWLLPTSAHPKSNGLYPPDYIELRLAEEDGRLHGRYTGRYRIPDQAISPVVSFEFEGKADRDRVSLPWSGSGGARGKIQLRLLTSETLEVSWVADQLSPELELISGIATLVRKLN